MDVKCANIKPVATYKVNANRTDVTFCVCIVSESQQQTRFANTRIANQEEFEQIITKRRKRKIESVSFVTMTQNIAIFINASRVKEKVSDKM